MFSAEPNRTQYDLNFQLFGFPVRVHPFFWLAGIILGAAGGGLNTNDGMVHLLIWVAVLFVSILVHELGHAFAFRYYGSDARVVLYMLGGLAIPESSPYGNAYTTRARSPWNHIVISFAGPAAGFLLAGIVVAVIYATRANIEFDVYPPFLSPKGISNPLLKQLVDALLYVNIFWGLVNLLPIYPLDGGQIARELCELNDPGTGTVRSLWLSVIAGALVAVVGAFVAATGGSSSNAIFIAIMFGSLAFSSWQLLQQITGRGGGYGGGGRPW